MQDPFDVGYPPELVGAESILLEVVCVISSCSGISIVVVVSVE